MSSQKPVIIIVPGAWHLPHHYSKLILELSSQGYTVLSPGNASTGPGQSAAGKSHLDDVQVIRNSLTPYLDEGKEAIIIAHSYGGVPSSESVEGYTVAERHAEGLKGGIRGLIFIGSILVPAGISMSTAAGGKFTDVITWVGEVGYPTEIAAEAVYSDLAKEDALKRLEGMVPQSNACFETDVTYHASSAKIAKVYIVCEKDKTVPLEVQISLAEGAGAEIVQMPYGHCPHIFEDGVKKITDIVKRL